VSISTYRFNCSIAVLIQECAGRVVSELPAGSELAVADGKPDPKGLVFGMYDGKKVFVFQRDLEERAEPIGSGRTP